jgi:hypothetical protein
LPSWNKHRTDKGLEVSTNGHSHINFRGPLYIAQVDQLCYSLRLIPKETGLTWLFLWEAEVFPGRMFRPLYICFESLL